jgi:hypothetical protein
LSGREDGIRNIMPEESGDGWRRGKGYVPIKVVSIRPDKLDGLRVPAPRMHT